MLYNRTGHSQDFSICFIIKNSLNSPRITFNFKTNFFSKANNRVVSMLYTLIKHATISQSESLLECFKWSDWLKKTKAVINVKPSKFTICDSSQTEIVWLVEFNTFAWLRKFLYSFNTESESGMSSELWLVKARKFFHMINNLLKAFFRSLDIRFLRALSFMIQLEINNCCKTANYLVVSLFSFSPVHWFSFSCLTGCKPIIEDARNCTAPDPNKVFLSYRMN